MVYMAADNNLYTYAYEDLAEMMKVGSTDEVAVVVYLDSYNESSNHIYLVEKGSLVEVATLPDLDTGDPTTLAKFVESAVKVAQAKHYCLVLWDHGGGWIGVCVDDDVGDYINVTELQQALESTGIRFDVVAFDACLMEMIEVAYQIMNCTDYVVGSEQVVPAYGYPNDLILAELAANPSMTSRELAKTFVKAYEEFYSQFTPKPYGYTQSAVETAALPAVRDAFNKLALELTTIYKLGGKYAAAIRRDRRLTTEFYYDFNVDTYDAAARLAEDSALSEFDSLSQALQGAMDAIGSAVVASWCNGIRAHGLSIYYPASRNDWRESYTYTAWARATLWDEWLKAFLGIGGLS